MATFTVSAVDGEAAARRHLRDLISVDPQCEFVGDYSTETEALRGLNRMRPDIMFVDVPKPRTDGFELARAVSGPLPLFILTSGYDKHALPAFEAPVFDYLLKPLEETRFYHSLGRAKEQITRESTAGSESLVAGMLERLLRARQLPQRIAVRKNGRVVLVTLDQIDWIEAADNYACLHCGGETHILRETMSDLERSLDPAGFVRVHRSAIVNIDRIRELRPWFRGDYRVVLADGTELTLTKNHRKNLESQLLLGSFAR